MEKKSSAYYQRLYRQRLREQGLVKKEVWILPEHASALMAVERKLRQPMAQLDAMEKEIDMSMQQVWSATALHKALSGTELFQGKRASVELIDGSEASLHVTMHDYGDLPLFVAVFGEQIIVEALLWPVSDVRDLAEFNEEVLRTHKLFPLSSIGLERLADGTDCYTMFGALSSGSALSDVVFEIELLADNVIKATEAYENHLVMQA
ncbi:biofilm formation regulator BacA [Halopseudomonas maritima]|uniref:biofilm formation regulator BacA n=1 Tax=Halopseudomonas maritima TaxID=2918528 RepID=UPI001EEBA865|nr:YjfI family protein [Halopseudomonas maritima]UJJ30719.1 YjfI family protein [Halopseudomonas maritima]